MFKVVPTNVCRDLMLLICFYESVVFMLWFLSGDTEICMRLKHRHYVFLYTSPIVSLTFSSTANQSTVYLYQSIYTHTSGFLVCTGQPLENTAQLRKLLKAQEGAGTLCDLFKSCSSDSLTDQFSFYGNTYIWECWIKPLVLFILHYYSKIFDCIKPS